MGFGHSKLISTIAFIWYKRVDWVELTSKFYIKLLNGNTNKQIYKVAYPNLFYRNNNVLINK